jgi:hypothetical protein
VLANGRLVGEDPDIHGFWPAVRWLFGPRRPILRAGGLYDIPLGSPPDTCLLGLPRPDEASPDALVAFTAQRLGDAAAHGGQPYTVTFHDWLTGSSNRLEILDEVLRRLAQSSRLIDARRFDPAAMAEVAPAVPQAVYGVSGAGMSATGAGLPAPVAGRPTAK